MERGTGIIEIMAAVVLAAGSVASAAGCGAFVAAEAVPVEVQNPNQAFLREEDESESHPLDLGPVVDNPRSVPRYQIPTEVKAYWHRRHDGRR